MKKLFCIIFVLMCFVMFGCEKKAISEDTIPTPSLLGTDLKFTFDTLYNLNQSKLTLGVGLDVLSVYDVVYLGIQGTGATEGDFLANGMVGPRATLDINKGINLIASKITKANVKWLMGTYTPRIGYSCTYNMLNNSEYKKFEHWIILNVFNF